VCFGSVAWWQQQVRDHSQRGGGVLVLLLRGRASSGGPPPAPPQPKPKLHLPRTTTWVVGFEIKRLAGGRARAAVLCAVSCVIAGWSSGQSRGQGRQRQAVHTATSRRVILLRRVWAMRQRPPLFQRPLPALLPVDPSKPRAHDAAGPPHRQPDSHAKQAIARSCVSIG